MRNPITISVFIAAVLQLAIIPWAAWRGTLNWQAGPLYLIFTLPAAAIIMLIGVMVTFICRTR